MVVNWPASVIYNELWYMYHINYILFALFDIRSHARELKGRHNILQHKPITLSTDVLSLLIQ